MTSRERWLDALRRAVEERERRDWDAYALARPGSSAAALRPCIAALLAEADIPSLRTRAARLTVEADPRVLEAAARVEASESRGADPAEAVVALFALRERLARESGPGGYAELALAADGFSPADVAAELDAAERLATRDAAREIADETDGLPGEEDVRDSFCSFFSPLLDRVEVRIDPAAAVAGMCKALSWPNRIAVVVRAPGPAASLSDRVASVGTVAHELGHAAQWRARAARGLGFLDFFSLTALDTEAAADLCERLLFETELGAGLGLPRSLWAKRRAETALRQVAQARFELAAHAAALDGPAALSQLWALEVDDTDPGGWSRDGHGFYTEDPMRRYAYPLAYVRSARLLAEVTLPLRADEITGRL